MDTVGGLEDITILSGLLAVGAPRQEVTADLDVVVRELAVLVIVHTEELSLLGGTELQAGDQIDELGDDGGHDESVGGAGDDGSDLPSEENVVAVEETTGEAGVDAVEANNLAGGEEGVEDETDHAADTVLSEHIEGVVDAEEELDLGGKIAGDTGNDTENDGCPGVDETGSGSSSNETGDGTRAPADHGPLAGQAVIEETPSHGGEHGSEARVPAGHGSAEVGTKGRAAVESEPSKPEEDGAEGDERDVVRAEVHHHLLVTSAEDPGVGESRHAGTDLDGDTTGVVEDAVLEGPAVGVPNPVCERAVDEGSPEEDEDHAGNDAATLSNGADGKRTSDGAEHHLVEGVEEGGNERGADRGGAQDLLETEVVHVADEGVSGCLAEGERVAPEIPLEDDDAEGHHDDPEHGEGRLSSSEAGVEESDAGDHDEDETGADQDEGLVTGLIPLVEVGGCGIAADLVGPVKDGRSAD